MSLRPYTKITIVQQSNDIFKTGRNDTIVMDFVSEGNITSTWQTLTDTAEIKLPRNIYYQDQNGELVNLGGQINGVGSSLYQEDGKEKPIFMRGDAITIELGYFFDKCEADTDEILETNIVFSGYITKIKNRIPIEIECEDEMWKLKQISVPNKTFKGSIYTVQSMLTEMLKGKNITVVSSVNGENTSIGDFRTVNDTIGSVLERLKTEGSIYSYIRVNSKGQKELRCSGIVYYPQDREEHVFRFQDNVIKDDLEYTRKDDINVAIKAHSQIIVTSKGINKDGTRKQTNERLEVMVDKNGRVLKSVWGSYQGSVVTRPYLGVTTEAELLRRATADLSKFYYTGFKGTLTTFGLPKAKHGDGAIIEDNILPERNGTYLIKSVVTTFGIQSIRQKIMLHLRIDKGFSPQVINMGL